MFVAKQLPLYLQACCTENAVTEDQNNYLLD